MRAGSLLRVAAVLDATGPAAGRHAGALGGFLRDGLTVADDARVETVTHIFHAGEPTRDEALERAPTRGVRLVRIPPRRPDIVAAALAAFHAGGGADLYVFPGGPAGTGLAARLAARTGGTALTGVLTARLTPGGVTCRRYVYAGHLVGGFALGPRPWCIALDAGWADADADPAPVHTVQAEAELLEDDVSAPDPLREIEQLEPAQTGDLETARLLVVAGRGAGSSGGVDRLAAAAARMGAAFGVTRPLVMNAWAAPDRQVGVSGTRTAPAVCIVAGASGAPAFIWGVERAGFIAAVDIDDHARIAGESDAFVVGDAVTVLEALADLLA